MSGAAANGMRPPVVAGVGGGVGATTLAVALRGHDAGRAGVEAADILACRGTLDSLRRVAEVLDRLDGTPPVLAVSLDGARVPRGPLRAHLEALDAGTSGIVPLPLVKEWRTVADPLPEAARLLVDPPAQLSRPLRSYAAALRELAAAVAVSGRLAVRPARGAPPTGRGGSGRDLFGQVRDTRRPVRDIHESDRGTRGPDRDLHDPVGGGRGRVRGPVRSGAAHEVRDAPAHRPGVTGWPTDPVGRHRSSRPPDPAERDTSGVRTPLLTRSRDDGTPGAAPRIVGTFRPVVASVSPAEPGPARGVRIVTAGPRVPAPVAPGPVERIEQAG